MPQIVTHAAYHKARSKIRACYLCGLPLSEPLANEHIIPKGILDVVRPSDGSWWRPILPVHEKCDQDGKRHGDEMLIALARGASGVEIRKESKDRLLKKAYRVPNLLGDGQLRFVVESEHIEFSFTHAVRGIHALLYGQFPSEETRYSLVMPIPQVDLDNGESFQTRSRENYEWRILTRKVLAHVCRTNSWDGLTAWGGNCEYRCAWMDNMCSQGRGLPSLCVWGLRLPGLQDWVSKTGGFDDLICGCYKCMAIPKGARTITLDEAKECTRTNQQEAAAAERENQRRSAIVDLRAKAGRIR